jgi:UDP-glucose 4-epimerase
MKKILVTGGAGYIGSFLVRELKSKGFEVVILDNLSYGHKDSVKEFRLENIDLVTQQDKLDELLSAEQFGGVVHMASFIQMGESYKDPGKYYRNNVGGFINLLESMVKHGVLKLVLSSTAGVYGNPVSLPIKENDSKNPLNPYGETKYIMERMLEDFDTAHSLKFVSLRYFNASGGALDGSIGEDHPDESHLIPNVISAAMKGQEFTLFGGDYKTKDGTCVRDYIHVLDLAENHTLALRRLMEGGGSAFYNVGQGKGYSNKEVIDVVQKVTGLTVNVKIAPKRPGDADELLADITKIKNELGWEPKHDLETIVKSAYLWHKDHPSGYNDR